MGKIFNYIRVSTKEQNEGRQIEAMAQWNEVNGVTNAIELIDKCSGTNTDRPNLQMLLKVVGEGDLVVIKSIDRLSRNYKECKQLWEQITSKGADIVVIDMPLLDTRQYKDLLGSFISDLILSVLGYVAQQETDFRKQRQMEGIECMKEVDGKKIISSKININIMPLYTGFRCEISKPCCLLRWSHSINNISTHNQVIVLIPC